MIRPDPHAVRRADDIPPWRRRTADNADPTLIGQLRRRLAGERDATPAPVRRRAAELLAALRRVAPSPLLVSGADADAALLLEARGLAEVRPHRLPRLILLVPTAGGARGE